MDTTQQPFGTPDRHDNTQDGDRDSWSTRFRRSSRDRKFAGVAGGIGRALDIDPVLIRVAFAVLTVFGGSGVALYALAWLLMPGERDEVSGLEALFGRGRSSVPTPLAIVLGIVVVGFFTSSFTWGLSLLPIAIGALVVFLIVGKHQAKGRRYGHGQGHGSDWGGAWGARAGDWGDDVSRKAQVWSEDFSRKAQTWSDEFSRRAGRWGEDFGRRAGGGSGAVGGPASRADRSPFERPAFWEDPASQQVNLSKEDRPAQPERRSEDDRPAATGPTTGAPAAPPAWDPLGAAPFAWDLPEPGPAPASPEEQRRTRRSRTTAAVVLGLAMIVAGSGALGQIAGWWTFPLAAIAGATLAVIALGVLFSAIRGRRSPLIGLGIVLAAGTAILTATEMTGQAGFGERVWAPTGVDTLQPSYALDAGDATLDLSAVSVPAGRTAAVIVNLGLGDLTVLLPDGAVARVGCTTNVGSVTCLTEKSDGFHRQVEASTPAWPAADRGTFDLDVHVGVGNLSVRAGG